MYAYIKGNLEIKTTSYVIIDVGGIGYKIFMSESAMKNLGEIGKTVKVYTYLKVQEDDMSLYGFNTNEELRLFEMLISVSGVGAKTAIAMLSNIAPSSFALAIITNDIGKLKKLPGIGAKTAQRLVLELKDKLKKAEMEEEEDEEIKEAIIDDNKISEAVAALQVLGYRKAEIEQALIKVDKENLTVEDIIRKGLANLAK